MIGQYDYVQRVKGGRYRHRYQGAVPMLGRVKRAIYYAQNGGRPLTVAQERQLRKTANRMVARESDPL
jgi:hypothetical protein